MYLCRNTALMSPIRTEFNANRNSSYLAIIAGQQSTTASQSTLTNGSSAVSLVEPDGVECSSSSTSSDDTVSLTDTLRCQSPDDSENKLQLPEDKRKFKSHFR